MVWFLLLVGSILVVECFLRLPLVRQIGNLVRLIAKVHHTLKSRTISDHWKERVLPIYAGQLFWHSITVFLLVCVALMPMAVIGYIGEALGIPFFDFLASLIGVLASTLAAIVYMLVRRRLVHV